MRLFASAGSDLRESSNGTDQLEGAARRTGTRPAADGFEVLERLHGDEAWREVPVIIVTAKDLTREDVDRLNGRVVKVLQKGAYQRRDLVRDIHAMIARQVAHS